MKKIIPLFTLLFFSIQNPFFAQPGIVWENTYGGTNADFGVDILIEEDSNYIVLGEAHSFDGDLTFNRGHGDFWLFKLDQSRQIIWQKTYGGSEGDKAQKLYTTTDGGYLLLGYTWSTDGDISKNNGAQDIWLVKTDHEGQMIWQKTYGGSNIDNASAVIPTYDGGYLIAGFTSSTDFDVPGVGGEDFDYSIDIAIADDGGYIVFGVTASDSALYSDNHGDFDFWVYKLSSTGILEWQKFYGGSDRDEINRVVRLENGNFILVGISYSSDGDLAGTAHLLSNAWMLCIDQNGNILWRKAYGGSRWDEFSSIKQLDGGDILVVGHSASADGDVQSASVSNDLEVWVVRFSGITNVENISPKLVEIKVVPNPASNYIEIISEDIYENCIVSIVEIYGEVLLRQPLVANRRIDVSTLPSGTYILGLECPGKSGSSMVIKI